MPVGILVINAVVVIQVRRAAFHAAANLGVQPHHQLTSTVPTVMLIATSLIYVLLCAPSIILDPTHFSSGKNGLSLETYLNRLNQTSLTTDLLNFVYHQQTRGVVMKPVDIANDLSRLVYAYNFYVYLITGKQFRSDLYNLFSRCLPSSCPSSSSPPHPPVVAAAAIVAEDVELERRVETDTV